MLRERKDHRASFASRARTAQATVQNFEDEYIKQLQIQISSLETECLYLYPFLRRVVLARGVQFDFFP